MLRLFTALSIPEDISQRLYAMTGGVPGAHWHPPENYHITLRFIGTVDEATANEIAMILEHNIRCPAFTLTLDGTGLFHNKGKPKIIWAGVRPSTHLQRLKDRIDRVLLENDLLAPDHRKHHPHVTLARLKGTSIEHATRFVEVNSAFQSRDFIVEDWGLYISHSTSNGPLYERINDYPLQPLCGHTT